MDRFANDKVMLRPITEDDRTAIVGYFNEPEVRGLRQIEHDALAPLGPKVIEETIDRWAATKTGLSLAITPTGSNEVVGHVLADWGWDPISPWLGVAVAPTHRRNGYGSAAAGLVLAWLFGQTVAHSVQAWTPDWNEPGIAFLGAIGFSGAGRVRRAWLRDGEWHHDLAFDLLRHEWAER